LPRKPLDTWPHASSKPRVAAAKKRNIKTTFARGALPKILAGYLKTPDWVSGSLLGCGGTRCKTMRRCRLAKEKKTAKPISVGSTKGYLKTPAQNENIVN